MYGSLHFYNCYELNAQILEIAAPDNFHYAITSDSSCLISTDIESSTQVIKLRSDWDDASSLCTIVTLALTSYDRMDDCGDVTFEIDHEEDGITLNTSDGTLTIQPRVLNPHIDSTYITDLTISASNAPM